MPQNIWDQRYANEMYMYGTEPNDFLRNHAQQLPVGQVLCIGEGEGRNSVYLASLGYDVTALDSSQVGLDKISRFADEKEVNVQLIHADLANYCFVPESWDAVVSIFCHLPREIRKLVHRQIINTLRPGGIFLLEAYTPQQLELATGGPPAVEMMMDLENLRHELAGLKIIHAQELQREIHEGELHHGLGAVVQVIAQKPG